jgi:hypothetical protein
MHASDVARLQNGNSETPKGGEMNRKKLHRGGRSRLSAVAGRWKAAT